MRLNGIEALLALLGKARNRHLVEALAGTGVEFVIIGGTALAYHGFRDPFEVDDLDLLMEPTETNAAGVVSVLSKEVPLYSVCAKSLARPGVKLSLKDQNFYAELLFAEPSVNAPCIFESGHLVRVGASTIRVASVPNLKIMKEQVVREFAAGLKKHQKDLEALRDA